MAPSPQPQLTLQYWRSDLASGFTAAEVALPLAMAFGVATGTGALEGLYGGSPEKGKRLLRRSHQGIPSSMLIDLQTEAGCSFSTAAWELQAAIRASTNCSQQAKRTKRSSRSLSRFMTSTFNAMADP